jgi:hypothetical protein
MLLYFHVTGNSSAAHGQDALATRQARTEGLDTALVARPDTRPAQDRHWGRELTHPHAQAGTA